MDLVTLDGLSLQEDSEEIFLDEIEDLPVSGNVPHYSALRNLFVSSDITGAGSFAGVTQDLRNGAAIGVSNVTKESGFGIFTDNNENFYIIAQEDKDAWAIINDNNLISKNGYYFGGILRNMGSGGAFEANALMLGGLSAEKNERYGDFETWGTERNTILPKIPGFTFRLEHRTIYHICKEIESIGRKLDKPIVLLLIGEPLTFKDIVQMFFNIVANVAKSFSPILGIPPSVVDSIVPIINSFSSGNNVSLNDIVNVSQFLAPLSIKGFEMKNISIAAEVYERALNGNYLDAAKILNVGQPELINLIKGDYSESLLTNSNGYTNFNRVVQNLQNFDTVNLMRSMIKSGTAKSSIIDNGTLTKVPAFQNALFAGQSGGIIGIMPGTLEFCNTVVQETNDIENLESHRAIILSALGYQLYGDFWDSLTLRSLIERAIGIARNGGKYFVIPASVPWFKRAAFAAEVALQSGIQVIAGINQDLDSVSEDEKLAIKNSESENSLFTLPNLVTGAGLIVGGYLVWKYLL